MLRRVGFDIAPGVVLHSRSYFCGRDVHIAPGAFVNNAVFFDRGARIDIGERVAVAMQVSFITSAHEIGTPDHRAAGETWRPEPISVGVGAWLGARCTIMPGVTVGAGAVVAAGSVVVRDVPANTLVAGVPARELRRL